LFIHQNRASLDGTIDKKNGRHYSDYYFQVTDKTMTAESTLLSINLLFFNWLNKIYKVKHYIKTLNQKYRY